MTRNPGCRECIYCDHYCLHPKYVRTFDWQRGPHDTIGGDPYKLNCNGQCKLFEQKEDKCEERKTRWAGNFGCDNCKYLKYEDNYPAGSRVYGYQEQKSPVCMKKEAHSPPDANGWEPYYARDPRVINRNGQCKYFEKKIEHGWSRHPDVTYRT